MTPGKEGTLAESWRRTLNGISTTLGRLAYVASLRNPNTGHYEHFGLSQKIGAADTDRMLRLSHHELFQEWLCFGLRRQKQEIDEYFSELEGDRREILANWLSIEPYMNWIPADSRDVERKLFGTDLQTVLDVIRAEFGVASRDPDS